MRIIVIVCLYMLDFRLQTSHLLPKKGNYTLNGKPEWWCLKLIRFVLDDVVELNVFRRKGRHCRFRDLKGNIRLSTGKSIQSARCLHKAIQVSLPQVFLYLNELSLQNNLSIVNSNPRGEVGLGKEFDIFHISLFPRIDEFIAP